ncbi:MAG TPA: class I SAM-dependent methyltransferase [Burkholderiales bacterium]|nr:class I SAM-dependent methyltransferase [Burkholderiales bacterium]
MKQTSVVGEAEARMFTAAAGYERYMGRWSRLLAPSYIAFAGVRDGARVLDVGTGTGALAGTLAATLPSCEVVGVDPSPAFIGYAEQNAKSGRARFEVGDAQALHQDDASFDHAMSLLVLNFVPDHRKALGEMRRVTRPGGVVSACVWDYDAGMEMLRFFWDEAVALDPAMAQKDERHMKLSREGQLRALWNAAGLASVQETSLSIAQAYASFDDYWAPFLKGAGPGGAYVASLSDERRRQLEARMRTRLLGAGKDSAFTLNARAWCVRGEVPKPR